MTKRTSTSHSPTLGTASYLIKEDVRAEQTPPPSTPVATRRSQEPLRDREPVHTTESPVPAAILSYHSTDNAAVDRAVSRQHGPGLGYTPMQTTPAAETSQPAPEYTPFSPRPKARTTEGTPPRVAEAIIATLHRIEMCTNPQRFSVVRDGGTRISLIAAHGKLAPTIEYQPPTDANAAESEPAETTERDGAIRSIWALLETIAERGEELHVADLDPEDPAYQPDETWLTLSAFAYDAKISTCSSKRVLVEQLREILGHTRITAILLRRARDLHPLMRVQNIRQGDHLTLRDLETLVRSGETISRQLSVMAGSAIPNASQWFGATAHGALCVIYDRDITFVAAFDPNQLGRVLLLADAIADKLRSIDTLP